MKILVTGAAGFIGMHTCVRLLNDGHEVIGLDNLNNYYSPALKDYRLKRLSEFNHFRFVKMDLANRDGMAAFFKRERFQRVIHLAAQAGVRYSIENPMAYVDSNLVGHMTILEGCRHNKIEHLVYASSSSVYGMNTKVPFSEVDNVDHPVSLYAATKKSNELMTYSYSHLYGLPATGLRFFTVYGPGGRPDMAPWLFTKAIIEGKPINVFNHGNMQRDFTYIDDIVEGVVRILNVVPSSSLNDENKDERGVCHRLYNIGNNQPVELNEFICAIEEACGKRAERVYLPMQAGDVPVTYADIENIAKVVNFHPKVPIQIGIERFVEWYKNYGNN